MAPVLSVMHAPKPVRPGRPNILDESPPAQSRRHIAQPPRARYDRVIATHHGVISLAGAASKLYEDDHSMYKKELNTEAWWTPEPRGRPLHTERNASTCVPVVNSAGPTSQKVVNGRTDLIAMPSPLPVGPIVERSALSPKMASPVAIQRPKLVRRSASSSVATNAIVKARNSDEASFEPLVKGTPIPRLPKVPRKDENMPLFDDSSKNNVVLTTKSKTRTIRRVPRFLANGTTSPRETLGALTLA
ncbi:hypothetical protein GY45DRAFT_1365501 [Cubamyces sp. BRFM 1775]|nr:hypothetical protein GY45DRAFT_1365501 [Cubamyces sp. BRFM 1775]